MVNNVRDQYQYTFKKCRKKLINGRDVVRSYFMSSMALVPYRYGTEDGWHSHRIDSSLLVLDNTVGFWTLEYEMLTVVNCVSINILAWQSPCAIWLWDNQSCELKPIVPCQVQHKMSVVVQTVDHSTTKSSKMSPSTSRSNIYAPTYCAQDVDISHHSAMSTWHKKFNVLSIVQHWSIALLLTISAIIWIIIVLV